MRKILFFLIFMFFFTSYVMAQTLYVQSIKAPIKEAPNFSAKVLWVAHRGDTLTSEKSKNDWYYVKFGSGKGWVPKLLVSTRPPMKKIISILEKTDVKLSRGARVRASKYTTAAAARGLSEERARLGKSRYKADFTALESVNSFKTNETELSRFMEEGGLE